MATEHFTGRISRIRSQRGEWFVANVYSKEYGSVTVVGVAGENVDLDGLLSFHGQWDDNPQWGRQFKCSAIVNAVDVTREGLLAFFERVSFGVGPVIANALIDTFGDRIPDIIEVAPERLLEIPGVGQARADAIVKSWKEEASLRELILFLSQHGVEAKHAVRMYNLRGPAALADVQKDPYILARTTRGIGFKTADKIAQQMGVGQYDPRRLRAGVSYTLDVVLPNQGHTCADSEALIGSLADLLELAVFEAREYVEEALDAAIEEGTVMSTKTDDGMLYSSVEYWSAEDGVARWAHRRSLIRLESQTVERIEKSILNDDQMCAVYNAYTSPFSILTGGPGTGKTTTLQEIARQVADPFDLVFAAPTGRAAKRMEEVVPGFGASTIHRLLGYNPREGGFTMNSDNPLRARYIVVDEVSMLDSQLAFSLIDAVSDESSLVLVGDFYQLPSVGAGNVLRDLIQSRYFPTINLTHVYRQAQESGIVRAAYDILNGRAPKEADDFLLGLELPTPKQLAELVLYEIPEIFDVHKDDVQVLIPGYRGDLGIDAVNAAIQQEVTGNMPPGVKLKSGVEFKIGDRVLQTQNNYNLSVMNGEIGNVTRVDITAGKVFVDFGDGEVEMSKDAAGQLKLAYAISAHKSQGSQFPIVVIVLTNQHYPLLMRNLLYTAVTRATKACVLIGDPKAIRQAVANNQPVNRSTLLPELLLQRFGSKAQSGKQLTLEF